MEGRMTQRRVVMTKIVLYTIMAEAKMRNPTENYKLTLPQERTT